MKKFAVTLTREERAELKKITSRGKDKSQKVLNSLVLLGCDEVGNTTGTERHLCRKHGDDSRCLQTALRCPYPVVYMDEAPKQFIAEMKTPIPGQPAIFCKGYADKTILTLSDTRQLT